MYTPANPHLPPGFWNLADRLLAESRIVVDRPRGSRHPRYPEAIYPLDYGYLAGTSSPDGHEVDVWVGSLEPGRVEGVLLAVDLQKRDLELKLLVGCTADDVALIKTFSNSDLSQVAAILRIEVPDEQ
jgi:inorganic pyrophosphatase